MRKLSVLLFVLLLTACTSGGGSPVADFDPSGHWVPVGSPDASAWEIRATGSGAYIMDFDAGDLVPVNLTVDGNSFTINGEEWDLSHRWHAVYTGNGTFNDDVMTGTWIATETDTQTGEIDQNTEQFTANRDQ
ncbi:MAG: hypothetical protein M3R04_05995 [bacterium]|nr:hypothetical protein [bacterium]